MSTNSDLKIDFPAIQTRYTPEEEQIVLETMRNSTSLTQGPELKAFEQEFAKYVGAPHALGVSSCTSALELAAVLSGIGEGDEVIVPAHTFVSSAVPFARTGARLVWADIDPDTRVVSAETIGARITDRTRVVVVVHLYGLMPPMDPIMELVKKHNLILVEDCAQAPGATCQGRRAGSFADFGCFSFHTQKNITTLGEGGMLTLRSDEMLEKAQGLRWMGHQPFEGQTHYWQPAMTNLVQAVRGVWPVNFCFGEVQAALGRALLKRLDVINGSRRRQADQIRNALADYAELTFQEIPEGHLHAYHLLSARYDGPAGKNRDDLIQLLLDEYRIKCIVQYWPLYRSDLFKAFGLGDADCPQTDRFFNNMLSFPWWTDMPQETIDYVISSIQGALTELR